MLWVILKKTGLHTYLKRKMKCLNFLRYSRPDRQISISARISVSSRSNNDAYEVLIRFLGRCRISVQQCMLRVSENISRQAALYSSVFPHLVSSVESRGKIVMLSEIVRIFYKHCDKNVSRADDRRT